MLRNPAERIVYTSRAAPLLADLCQMGSMHRYKDMGRSASHSGPSAAAETASGVPRPDEDVTMGVNNNAELRLLTMHAVTYLTVLQVCVLSLFSLLSMSTNRHPPLPRYPFTPPLFYPGESMSLPPSFAPRTPNDHLSLMTIGPNE